ncbi:hypothetical protein [Calothrix sp. CCY 0018]|uniref:hypothetical protein n=1 Tax=Calothrix sp. CCY 0018 TaxID=3103864 RepID=UPI0039C5D30B
MFETEFEFTLPKGYLDPEGNLHRKGIMRLSTAIDEIAPLRDPRVKANPAYVTIIILARVIKCLGALSEVTPAIVENFFSEDLEYLSYFYRRINGLDDPVNVAEETEPEEALVGN